MPGQAQEKDRRRARPAADEGSERFVEAWCRGFGLRGWLGSRIKGAGGQGVGAIGVEGWCGV